MDPVILTILGLLTACVITSFGVVFIIMFRNRINVDVDQREAVVIWNPTTGEMRVLRQGSHPQLPGWGEHTRVDLNIEQLMLENLEVKAIDPTTNSSVVYVVNVVFDVLAGRLNRADGTLVDYDPLTGDFTTPEARDNFGVLTATSIIRAVTSIRDFAKRFEYVANIVKQAADRVFARRTPTELSLTPVLELLLNELAIEVDVLVDRELASKGFNTMGTRVENLRAKNELTETALEAPFRVVRLSEAEQRLRRDNPDLSAVEAIAIAEGQGQIGYTAIGTGLRIGLSNFSLGA